MWTGGPMGLNTRWIHTSTNVAACAVVRECTGKAEMEHLVGALDKYV